MHRILFFLLFLALCSFSENQYRFVIFGERTDDLEEGRFAVITESALKINPAPAFIINTGDMIPGYTRDTSALINQWLRLETALKSIRDRFSWHPVPGDRDISYDYALPIYKLYVGAPYYSFDEGRDHFVVLDNSRLTAFEKMETPQLSFLRKDLTAARKARHIFCFLHKPFYLKTPAEPSLTKLHTLLKQNRVDYVISGGHRGYTDLTRDGIHYLTVGNPDSSATNGKTGEGALQYLVVDITAKSVEIKPVYLNNK